MNTKTNAHMRRKRNLKKILQAVILLILLIVQVVVLQTEFLSPETVLAIYVVEVLKVFIYINLAWLLILAIRFLTKNRIKHEKK